MGISNSDYARLLYRDLADITAYSATGTCLSVAANRLSYVFNFRGPSMAVDTACSSSLVAVHLACASLRRGEADLALAGGVNLILTPEGTIAFSQARMMAADGRCKTFDDQADGYVRGEGCGLVVLKRLSDAPARRRPRAGRDPRLGREPGRADQRPDGPQRPCPGGGHPRGPARRRACSRPRSATSRPTAPGTSLGDPIEVKALKGVLMEGRSAQQPCWLGSVKTNVGHLESAAGIARLIKVVLALQHRKIPANLHFTKLNRYIASRGRRCAWPPSAPTGRCPGRGWRASARSASAARTAT